MLKYLIILLVIPFFQGFGLLGYPESLMLPKSGG